MYYNKIKKISLILLISFATLLLFGCDESFQTYIKKDFPLHKVKKIVVFPFRNLSKEKNADDMLRNAINIELMKSGLIEIINLNEAEKALKEARIRTAGGVEDLSVSQAKKLGESLGVQGAVLGVIEDFGSGGKTGAPQFSGYLYMIDTNDGNVIWSCSYTGSGDSRNYIFDLNRIETSTLHAREVMKKMFTPLIRKAKTSESDALREIGKYDREAQAAENNAKKAEDEAKKLDAIAIEQEEQATKLEKDAEESADKALRMNPQAIADDIKGREGELAAKSEKLTQSEEESKKIESVLGELSQKVKQLEESEKTARAEAEEIAGQVNIYTAKQRVAIIRNNTEEAEKFKALAEEAKTKGEEATAKAENLKKEVTEAKAKVDEMTPKINTVRKNVTDFKAEIDKLTAKLAEIKQIQGTIPEPTEEIIAQAKQAEEQAKTLKVQATAKRDIAVKARKDAEFAKERAKKARQTAIDTQKKATEIKAKLS